MIYITYYYPETSGTKVFIESGTRLGIEIINLCKHDRWVGNKQAGIEMFEALKNFPKNEFVCYADGADSIIQAPVTYKELSMTYQTELACYPHIEMAEQHPESASPFKFLNGGGWVGNVGVIVDFYEKYLKKYLESPEDLNGQHIQQLALVEAIKDKFPIRLDNYCKYYQSIAFIPKESIFKVNEQGLIDNTLTKSTPSIFHGNGKTDMQWLVNHFNLVNL